MSRFLQITHLPPKTAIARSVKLRTGEDTAYAASGQQSVRTLKSMAVEDD